jgi:hypothetical protein
MYTFSQIDGEMEIRVNISGKVSTEIKNADIENVSIEILKLQDRKNMLQNFFLVKNIKRGKKREPLYLK